MDIIFTPSHSHSALTSNQPSSIKILMNSKKKNLRIYAFIYYQIKDNILMD